MPRLFSYGTLQNPDVQLATFGRHLRATPDELVGFALGSFRVADPAFVASSGKAVHAIVRFTGRSESRVAGMVLELTESELAQADAYEPDGYARVRAQTLSGNETWVYAEDPPSHPASWTRGGRARPRDTMSHDIWKQHKSYDARVHIEPATPNDLSAIRAAYAHGRNTQRDQGSSVWPDFSDAAILGEIDAGELFRVVVEASLAGVFSVAHDDPAIWGSLERGAHLYLHRIARAADWTGRGLMDAILDWAAARCSALGRDGLRIDTWASNAPLIAFYERRGFRLVGQRRLGVDPRLPPHYHGNEFALLEWTRERPADRPPDIQSFPS